MTLQSTLLNFFIKTKIVSNLDFQTKSNDHSNSLCSSSNTNIKISKLNVVQVQMIYLLELVDIRDIGFYINIKIADFI